jgi:N-acetylneuraminic acid mutarotase
LAQTVEIYNIATNTWTYGNPTLRTTAGPSGGMAGGKLMIEGGTDLAAYYNDVQVSVLGGGGGGGCATNTPGPSATNTPILPTPTQCTSGGGGTPDPWVTASPMATDEYGGFTASDGTYLYAGGGYSFTASGQITTFARFNAAAGTWTPLAAVPDIFNGLAMAEYVPSQNKIYVMGGDDATTGTVVNTNRIYDIATNTWSTGAAMPGLRAFSAHGYSGGKIYIVGGYSTGNVSPAFGQVWEYDPVANTWNTSRADMPALLGGAASGVINGHIIVAGGRTDANIV